VLDGTQLSQKRGKPLTRFSADVYCGPTAGWIKMPLGTVVDVGPGYIVLDGDPAPRPRKGHSSPLSFRPMSIVATVTHPSYS